MIAIADARRIPLRAESVDCCVTSPPYWGLRDYGTAGQLGLEPTPEEYVANMVEVFREVRRVLKPQGTLWLNLGDSFAQSGGPGWQGKSGQRADRRFTGVRDTVPMREIGRRPPCGLKPKDLVGMPWRVAFALQADGWWVRMDIIWAKPNPMPESVTDRPTKAHEYLFLLAKSERYYYDSEAIREPQVTDFDGDGRHPIPPAAGAQPKRPSGWSTDGGGHTALAGRYDYRKSRAGISADDYDARKWRDRSDGRSRPPMTMRDRKYNPLGRNRRSVWTVSTKPYPGAHFATFPPDLISPCILAGCPPGGIVLDPFVGSGTTVKVARELGREGIGLDISFEYIAGQAKKRIKTQRGFTMA